MRRPRRNQTVTFNAQVALEAIPPREDYRWDRGSPRGTRDPGHGLEDAGVRKVGRDFRWPGCFTDEATDDKQRPRRAAREIGKHIMEQGVLESRAGGSSLGPSIQLFPQSNLPFKRNVGRLSHICRGVFAALDRLAPAIAFLARVRALGTQPGPSPPKAHRGISGANHPRRRSPATPAGKTRSHHCGWVPARSAVGR